MLDRMGRKKNEYSRTRTNYLCFGFFRRSTAIKKNNNDEEFLFNSCSSCLT